MIFTSNGTFKVPEGVTQIIVSGCAAGGNGIENQSGSNGNGLAGEFVIDKALLVIPKEEISIVVGRGNTIIGNYLTLIANTLKIDCECFKLGYKTGIKGTRYSGADRICGNAYSGAFGYGGGAGGLADYDSSGTSTYEPGPTIGVWYGDNVSEGGLAVGSSIKDNANGTAGKVYGSGSGGIASTSNSCIASGGGAGGYGAGGGAPGVYVTRYSSTYGKPGQGSPGIVIIEW